MNILLLIDRMDVGGAETHVAHLARALHRLGHCVTVQSAGGGLADELAVSGIRHRTVPFPGRNPLALLRARRCLHRFLRREHFDIVHAHTRLGAWQIRGAHRYGCAEVVTVHAHFTNNAFLARICYWGQLTLAVSEDLRAYVIHGYRLPPERVHVIPNGIDTERFHPAPHRRTLAPIVLFASRMDDDCALGAELLCRLAPRLWARYPTVQILLAGGGSAYRRIQAQAEALNRCAGREAVLALGAVSNMPELMQRATLFVGVSRAALEAAACGCAVILCGNEGYVGIWEEATASVAAHSNFCGRGEPAPSADRLYRDVTALLVDPVRWQRAADAACSYVRSHLRIEALARDTLALYRQALPRRGSYRVLLGGYFGCGNLGDDAILGGMLAELSRAHPAVTPILLSGAPTSDARRFGIRACHRKHPLAVLLALARADLFVLGGGSLLQNRSGNLSLAYYLALLVAARCQHVPAALYACGIGPLLGERPARITARVLASVCHVGLRDARSQQALLGLGLAPARLSVGADAALLSPPSPTQRVSFLRQRLGIPTGTPCLGIVLRGGSAARPLCGTLAHAVQTVCERHGLIPLVLVLDRRHDAKASRAFAKALQSLGARCVIPQACADAKAYLAGCHAVLSMRLHGLILATAAGTPALGIASDPQDSKLAAYAAAAHCELLVRDACNGACATQAIEALLATDPHRRAQTARAVDEMRKKAQIDLANTLQIVYNKGNDP